MPRLHRRALSALLLALEGGWAMAASPLGVVKVGAVEAAPHFEAPGHMEAVRQATLAAQAAGRITRVEVRIGDVVKQGQVLLRIDSPAARAAAVAGGAQADAAAAQLASARADFDRARRLHEKQYLSDAALQRAEAQLRSLEAQATSTKAQAQAAQVAAGWEELRAPYDGRVTAMYVAAGDLAQPGQPLVAVYSPGAMRVLADVPEGTANQLALDRPVRLAYASGGCPRAPEQVTAWTLVPSVDSRSRSVGVRVELPASEGCVPGTLVRVRLPLRGAQASLTVPAAALVRRGELDGVYVVDAKGRVSLRQVRLGEHSGDAVEVLAGLEAGEQVLGDAASYRPAVVGQGVTP